MYKKKLVTYTTHPKQSKYKISDFGVKFEL